MSYGDKEENGIIESTQLGIEDHGSLSFYLHLKFDGTGQGFGGYCLDEPYFDPNAPDLKSWEIEKGGRFVRRRGHGFGADLILKILQTLEVNNWENLKGTNLRVRRGDSRIQAIGHIYKDKWLDMDELRQEWFPDRED